MSSQVAMSSSRDGVVVTRGLPEPQRPRSRGSSRSGSTYAEVAGGTTADCAAVCCCCPCVVASLAVTAVYKVPAGLCRKALKSKRRRRLMKKRLIAGDGLQHHHSHCQWGYDDSELGFHSLSGPEEDFLVKSLESNDDVDELETEMWNKFHGAGFWRSPSQKLGKFYDSD